MNLKKAVSASLFVLATVLLGFMLGGFLGGRVLGGGGMGWDQIADALGGAFLGTLGGLILSVSLVTRLNTVQILKSTAGVILAVVLLGFIFRAFPARPIGASEADPPESAPAQPVEPKAVTEPNSN